MFTQINPLWLAGAATFAAACLFTLMGGMRRFLSRRLTRLAGVALVAPLMLLGLTPAATFAAAVHPSGDLAARVSVGVDVNGPATLAPGSAFTYQITVTNDGPGFAEHTRVDLPLDTNVVVDDFTGGSASIFVQTLNPDMISIQFGELGPGSVTTVSVSAHVSADATAALTLSGHAMVNWDDANPNRSRASNDIADRAVNGGAPLQAAPLTIAADGPVDAGTLLAVTGTGYAAGERVSLWINTPAGITLPADSLGQTDSTLAGTVVGLDALGLADDQGTIAYTLDTTGLPSGTYSLVAHGWASGLEAVAAFTIK
jgi:hypothetical protein